MFHGFSMGGGSKCFGLQGALFAPLLPPDISDKGESGLMASPRFPRAHTSQGSLFLPEPCFPRGTISDPAFPLGNVSSASPKNLPFPIRSVVVRLSAPPHPCPQCPEGGSCPSSPQGRSFLAAPACLPGTLHFYPVPALFFVAIRSGPSGQDEAGAGLISILVLISK